LISYFWVHEGHFRKYGESILDRIDPLLAHSLAKSVRSAIDHKYLTSHFITADYLHCMLDSTESKQG